MSLKVKEVTGTPTRTTTTLEIAPDLNAPEKLKRRIKQDVGEFLVASILSSVGSAESPVKGEGWPELSKGYKLKKKDDGLPGQANMEFEGDMLDSLTFRETKEGIELGFFDKQAWKADGHLKFSGEENNTPKRRFLPGEGQEFKAGIQREVEKIIADAVADESELSAADLENVETKAELYALLAEIFPGLGRSETRQAVLRSPRLARLLDDEDLLDLL